MYRTPQPTIIESTQSATTVLAQDTVSFQVTARDDEALQLRFTWAASVGALGTLTSTATRSEVSWTAPLCVPAGTLVTVTVTVTNDASLFTSKSFTLSANPCPTPTVSGGNGLSLALRSDGTVWAWGSNGSGQLGDGTTTHRLTPVQVSGLTRITAGAASSAHSLAERSDGTGPVWGANGTDLLGDGKMGYRPPLAPPLVP